MRKTIAGAALAAILCSGSGIRAQEEEGVKLRCVAVPSKERASVRLEGTAGLAEGTVVAIGLSRVEERWGGTGLVPEATCWTTIRVAVKGGKIPVVDRPVEGPGVHRVIVEREGGKPIGGGSFEFAAWGDELASEWSPGLEEVDRLAEETLKLLENFFEAGREVGAWNKSSAEILKRVALLGRKLEASKARRFYPAALASLSNAIRRVQATAARMRPIGDQMGIPRTSSERGLTKDLTPADFGLRPEVEGAAAIAGRELALWVVKDFRRAGARPELVRIVQEQERHVGVAPFADRLVRLLRGQEEPEPLEKEMRGEPFDFAEGRSREKKP